MRGLAIAEVLSFQLDAANGSPAGAVAFEWIGADNYLRERHFGKVAKNSQRRRGRNATSADFAFRVRLDDGRVGLILGEWKYCESYRPKNIRYSGKTDRLAIYEHALERLWPHLSLPGGASWEDLFFDPFGQLMRLQLLAAEIERAGREGRPEMDATFACVLHVAPRANSELRERITSEGLKHLGNDIHQVWARIAPEGRFFGVDSEALLAAAAAHMPDRASAAYLEARYLPMR